jgi:hypothetical protein
LRRSAVAAQSLHELGIGDLVVMLVLGVLLILWPLAVITNFHGYRDAQARRALKVPVWPKRRASIESVDLGSEADRRFANTMQFIVAGVFLLAACALIVVAIIEIADRSAGAATGISAPILDLGPRGADA